MEVNQLLIPGLAIHKYETKGGIYALIIPKSFTPYIERSRVWEVILIIDGKQINIGVRNVYKTGRDIYMLSLPKKNMESLWRRLMEEKKKVDIIVKLPEVLT
ncbi:putative protein DNA-binding protein [Saccharolobus shibatae B12]|uniref:Uncharacterized protein n=1 Tax=Saccharolobus shibatae (strain ATCC 51178 / DSM 5389 / JCM 8931 / NBRC 15437 / B12) TaxID=523848 RepID=A0A8F5GV29_SACSH|nr:putative protein DNA-binding protein [Saccharolobus shibatae B12]QXJ29987.1 putative protein DNA-binding protein [Saccharolobus shibatae B12]